MRRRRLTGRADDPGLARLRDPELVPRLLRMLGESESLSAQAAILDAIGTQGGNPHRAAGISAERAIVPRGVFIALESLQ